MFGIPKWLRNNRAKTVMRQWQRSKFQPAKAFLSSFSRRKSRNDERNKIKFPCWILFLWAFFFWLSSHTELSQFNVEEERFKDSARYYVFFLFQMSRRLCRDLWWIWDFLCSCACRCLWDINLLSLTVDFDGSHSQCEKSRWQCWKFAHIFIIKAHRRFSRISHRYDAFIKRKFS